MAIIYFTNCNYQDIGHLYSYSRISLSGYSDIVEMPVYNMAESIEWPKKKCNCPINVLMAKGCQCGGI